MVRPQLQLEESQLLRFAAPVPNLTASAMPFMPLQRPSHQRPPGSAITRRGFGLLSAGAALCPSVASASRPEALNTYDQLFDGGRYLPHYLELQRQAEAGDEAVMQDIAQFAAIVGDEDAALRYAGAQPMRRSEARPLDELEIADAIGAIVAAAASAQIVILNEAHHVSAHRAFAGRVAEALAQQGFTAFAAEAFGTATIDTVQSVRSHRPGAPLTMKAGYYVLDPVFAETARRASRAGLALVDYEQRWDQRSEDPSFDVQAAARELSQAQNLVDAVLKRDPKARIFVYCGYDHVTEAEGPGGLWFAGRLKALTGIDPLTIEQSQNWPRLNPEDDPPHIRSVLAAEPKAPVAVRLRSGQPYTAGFYTGRVDMTVFHPRYAKADGRPGWLAADTARRRTPITLDAADTVRLVQAFHVSEGWGSLPADQALVDPGASDTVLFLPPGEYVVRAETPDAAAAVGKITVTT